MSAIEMFLGRCRAFCDAVDIALPTLSTKLFNDGKRLTQLAAGTSDIGVRRLAKANVDLNGLLNEQSKISELSTATATADRAA